MYVPTALVYEGIINKFVACIAIQNHYICTTGVHIIYYIILEMFQVYLNILAMIKS